MYTYKLLYKVANDIPPNLLKGFNFVSEIGNDLRHQSMFRRPLFKGSSPNFTFIQSLLKSTGEVTETKFGDDP